MTLRVRCAGSQQRSQCWMHLWHLSSRYFHTAHLHILQAPWWPFRAVFNHWGLLEAWRFYLSTYLYIHTSIHPSIYLRDWEKVFLGQEGRKHDGMYRFIAQKRFFQVLLWKLCLCIWCKHTKTGIWCYCPEKQSNGISAWLQELCCCWKMQILSGRRKGSSSHTWAVTMCELCSWSKSR